MSDKNKKIRIGLKGGDIPVFPPVVFIALCVVATILSLALGRHKFLPIWGDGLALRVRRRRMSLNFSSSLFLTRHSRLSILSWLW